MNSFDELRTECLLLIGMGSPVTHRIAGRMIQQLSQKARDSEQKKRLHQAATLWLGVFDNMQRGMGQMRLDTHAFVECVQKDNKPKQSEDLCTCDDKACVSDGDAFFDDFPFDGEAQKPNTSPPKVRPSKVLLPGSLDDALKKIRALQSEDELRAWCIFGPEMTKDGRIPRLPLVKCPTITASNEAIVRIYRENRIVRTWLPPTNWETALVEDMTLLTILVAGDASKNDITFHSHLLLPYTRRWSPIQLGSALNAAHRKLIKAKMIARCKPRTFELRAGWEEKLRPTLLAAWETAKDTEGDGGPSNAGGGAA